MEKNFGKCCFLLIYFQLAYSAETTVTYNFPTDACLSEPYIVDENSLVYIRFDGGSLGSQDCRKMKFTTPHKTFYHYTLCMRMEYFDSPNCSISIGFRKYENKYIYWDNDKIYAAGCSRYTYDYSDHFAQCLDGDRVISFELKNGGRDENNRYDNDYNRNNRIDKTSRSMSERNRFKIQLEAKMEPNYGLIGGLAGGLAGLVLLIAIGTCICVKCRKRKHQTGRYCCSVSSYDFGKTFRKDGFKEFFSHGCSTQCAVGGILLCSCVFCQLKNRQTDAYEAVPITHDQSDSNDNVEQSKDTIGYKILEPDTIQNI